MAVDSGGNGIVVFEQFNAGLKSYFIVGASLPFNAAEWSSPQPISGPGSLDPIVVVNSIGDGVALWKNKNQIFEASGFSSGNWSLFRTLSTTKNSLNSPYNFGLDINLHGNIFAAWAEDPNNTNSHQVRAIAGIGITVAGTLPPLSLPVIDAPLPNYNIEEIGGKTENRTEEYNKERPWGGNFAGYQVLHRFPAHADLINILNWTAPAGVNSYKIYREDTDHMVGRTVATYFEDHQRSPGKEETYLITSVDIHGQESSPITIIVAPMR